MSESPTRQTHNEHSKNEGFSLTVLYLFSEERPGTIQIEICDVCHFIVTTICEHNTCSWNTEGTVLTCNLCKADCT